MPRFSAAAVAWLVLLATAAGAQVAGYQPRTGDAAIDARMVSINAGSAGHDVLVDAIVRRFGAPRYLVAQLMSRQGWTPADVYYACALAYEARRPSSQVAHAFEASRAQGWAAIATSFGVKPGSPQAAALDRHFDNVIEAKAEPPATNPASTPPAR